MASAETTLSQAPIDTTGKKGQNGIRRAERWVYGLPLDVYHRLRYPKAKLPNDITQMGMDWVQQSADAGLDETPLRLRRRWKNTRKLLYGFSRDIFDGIRARRLQRKGIDYGNPRYGELFDLAVDRTQEMYLAWKISLNNWRHARDKDRPEAQARFIDSLLTATATILPTIAGAQGRMLGIPIPEKSPDGGSRFDRIIQLKRSFSASAKGSYEKSETQLLEMRRRVESAYKYRSGFTNLYRTDISDLTSFDIASVQPDNFRGPEFKKLRQNVETWLHFVWFTNQAVAFIQDRLQATGNGHMVDLYLDAVGKQLGGYQRSDGELQQIAEQWQDAFPDEFNYVLSKTLRPQALIRS